MAAAEGAVVGARVRPPSQSLFLRLLVLSLLSHTSLAVAVASCGEATAMAMGTQAEKMPTVDDCYAIYDKVVAECGQFSEAAKVVNHVCKIKATTTLCTQAQAPVTTREECSAQREAMKACRTMDMVSMQMAKAFLDFSCDCVERWDSLLGDRRDLCDTARGMDRPEFRVEDFFPAQPTARAWLITSSPSPDSPDVVATRKQLVAYAAQHNYGYSVATGVPSSKNNRHAYWVKAPLVLRAMGSPRIQAYGVKWFIWVDADVLVTNLSVTVDHLVQFNDVKDTDLFVVQEDPGNRWPNPLEEWSANCGIFLARNHPWTFNFLVFYFDEARKDGFHCGLSCPDGRNTLGDQMAVVRYHRTNAFDAKSHIRIAPLNADRRKNFNSFLRNYMLPDELAWTPGAWSAHLSGLSDYRCHGQPCRVCLAEVMLGDTSQMTHKDVLGRCF